MTKLNQKEDHTGTPYPSTMISHTSSIQYLQYTHIIVLHVSMYVYSTYALLTKSDEQFDISIQANE